MLKHPKRPRDPFALAVKIGREATGQDPKPPPPEEPSEMAARGRKGGKVGGRARANAMTPEQRSEVARKAARARWGK